MTFADATLVGPLGIGSPAQNIKVGYSTINSKSIMVNEGCVSSAKVPCTTYNPA